MVKYINKMLLGTYNNIVKGIYYFVPNILFSCGNFFIFNVIKI